MCLRSPEGREFYECDITRVVFLRRKEETIRRYVATGEPMGKAGAYAPVSYTHLQAHAG